METNKIIKGDCIEIMKTLDENSVDAIITDPPYGLEFMGKDWDKFKQGKNIAGGDTGLNSPYGRSKALPSFYQMKKKKRFGRMGEEGKNDLKVKKNFKVLPRFYQSDMDTLQEFVYSWAVACLRVLKPGGFLLAMGGTRTYHRLVCGIENAGFEIRDTIMWLYGSGFPKSLNIGKQIDKIQGNEREVVGEKIRGDVQKAKEKGVGYLADPTNRNNEKQFGYGTEILTKGNSEWEGWGTALKPACEPIVVARKPLSEKNVALNVLKWGTGGINIDECRIGYENTKDPATNPLYRKQAGYKNKNAPDTGSSSYQLKDGEGERNPNQQGRFPSNIILDEEAGKMLDEQSGESKSSKVGFKGIGWKHSGNTKEEMTELGYQQEFNDKGGASRFFYCAKASKSERNFGCESLETKDIPYKDYRDNVDNTKSYVSEYPNGKPRPMNKPKNNHPTVKPIKLMEYLIKLVSRESSIILDPFIGSGTTAIACIKLSRKFIGIEKEEEYIKIAQARIKPFLEQRKLTCSNN